MSNAQITVEQFRTLALERFDFLEAKGFRRMLSLEETTSTSGTVIYMGKHVGFIFSLDVRDQCVDAQVVKVRDGQLKPSWEGGYSSDIFTHLVKHMGYRGRLAGSVAIGSSDVGIPHLERMIDGWLSLLKEAGQTLVSDQADSLPG